MALNLAQVDDTQVIVDGNKRIAYGTFTQVTTDTGGDITTGLYDVEYFACTGLTTYTESAGVVSAVTLDPGKNQAGYWMAIGY